jgi:hypothetical protein
MQSMRTLCRVLCPKDGFETADTARDAIKPGYRPERSQVAGLPIFESLNIRCSGKRTIAGVLL